MKDTWFIFDTNGNFLFKTTNENRANINKIPTNFNAKYIIKNPTGYDENKEQHISYNISSNSVIFAEISSFEHMNSTNEEVVDAEELEIVDYKELFTDLKNAFNEIGVLQNTISILSDRLDSNVSTLNGRIDTTNSNVAILSDRLDSKVSTLNGRIDSTNSNVDILSDKLDSNTNTIDSVFTNVE